MNRLIVITILLLLSGCKQYKCIDGVIHVKLDEDVWKVSNMYFGERCAVEKETQK